MGIDEYVKETRERVGRIAAGFTDVASTHQKNLQFRAGTIGYDFTTTVEKRELSNNTLISGHPKGGKHGSAAGVSGDQRPQSWSTVTYSDSRYIDTQSLVSGDLYLNDPHGSAYSVSGWQGTRNSTTELQSDTENMMDESAHAIRQALTGGTDPISAITVQTGRADETRIDGGKLSVTHGTNGTTATGRVRWHDHRANSLGRVVTMSKSGRELSEAYYGTYAPMINHDIRVVYTYTATADAARPSGTITDALTTTAEKSLLPRGDTDRLSQIAVGTGDATGSTLDSEVIRLDSAHDVSGDQFAVGIVIHESEPASQPVDLSEASVVNTAGNPVWLTSFDDVTKTSEDHMSVAAIFDIQV